MKRIELLFSAILVPVDYLMIVVAGLTAHALRFGTPVTDFRPTFDDLSLAIFFPALLLAALGWLVIFALSGLYTIRGNRRFIDEFTTIFLACSTSIMAVIVLFFFQRELFSSRFILITGWVLAIIFVAIGRLIVRSIQHSLLKRRIGVYRVAIIGQDRTTARLVDVLKNHAEMGYEIVEQYPAVTETIFKELEARVGDTSKSAQAGLDVLFQADPTLPKEQTQRLIDFCNDHHLTFRYAADLFEAQATTIDIETLGGIPIIELRRTQLDGWGRILKRSFDLVLSAIAIIFLSPLFLAVAFLIKADSAGPVVVRLRRVGESGRPFSVYKFRSMIDNAHALKEQLMPYNERSGPLFKMKNDPRITRVGRFLRRSSIDELPQLLNVLRGDMSLVGPRPHEPEEVARYNRSHRKLLTIRPGITGLAQVSGRSDLTFDDEAKLDIYYIENWSLRLDLAVLFRTPVVVLRMKSAA